MPEERLEPAAHIEEAPEAPATPRSSRLRPSFRILMTHTPRSTSWSSSQPSSSPISSSSPSSSASQVVPTSLPSPLRPSERSVFFPNGVPTNLEEIRPIIAQAYSNPMALTSWFNVRLPGQQNQVTRLPESSEESYVVDIEEETSPTTNTSQPYDHNHTATTNSLLNIREASTTPNGSPNPTNNISSNNNVEDQQSLESLPISPESRELFQAIQNHLPFVALLIVKCIYDHRIGTLCFFVLLFVFVKTNNDLKKEIAKQQNQTRRALVHILFYIIGALAIIYFAPNRAPLFYSTDGLLFWELLWSIIVTDFVLKLITVALKTLVTCLPSRILVFPKRGKYYLWMEATSQFYRSTVPMYSWMSYLKNAYQWPEVTLGIILMILYGATKIREFVSRWKFLQSAFIKFCQNVSLGSSPSKEQLAAAGGVCVICHEEYSIPVRLHCKHIFCEGCVSTWLDRERTCPLCRTAITDDPVYRDGHTTHFIQLY